MKKICSAIFMLFCAAVVSAQSTISVRVQNLVAVDEQFNVTFIIDGEHAPSDFEWSAGDDFQLVWGPQKGSSTSVSIINGKSSRSTQNTYTYVLLPKRTGKFNLPVAVATVKGKQISSKSVTVEVVSNGAAASSSTPSQDSQQSQNPSQTGTVSSDDLFLRFSLSKTSVMVGETITATLKLYQRVNIAGFEEAKFPTFNGFWSQEIQAPTNIEFQRESVGDRIYNSAVLRSWNLVAQQAGEIKIDPAELVCLVNVRAPRASTGSIFDSFFQDDYQTIRKRVTSGSYTVHVQPLPAGAPDSFHGGVGKFNMDVKLTRDSLKTHDAASLKVTVTGTGNTTLLGAPKVNFPPDFEVYDVKVSDVPGGKLFEFPFIPRSYGDFEIEPVKYSYFDSGSRRYVTLESGPLAIKVGKGADTGNENAGTLVQGINKKDVRDLGSDIRFISSAQPSLFPVGAFFVGSTAFWIIVLLLLLSAAALYFVFRRVSSLKADVAGSKNRAANKMARKRLSQAGTFLKGNLYTAFYEELHKALLGYVSDKMTMDAAEMSKENISDKLASTGVPKSVVSDFIGLLDACEFARYSPDAGHDAMNAHFESAVSVISAIEDSMKRKGRSFNAAAGLLILLLAMPGALNARNTEQADSLWNTAVNAYSAGQWEQAISAWEAIETMGLESSTLYYNLGNAYYKAGDIGHSVLGYERALKLDPSNADARYNLDFVQNEVQDKIEEIPDFFLEVIGKKMCGILPSDVWAWLFIILFAAALALTLVFLLGKFQKTRKIGFISGIVALVLALLCLDFAFWQKTDYRKSEYAVVVRAVTSVKSSPDNQNGKDLFVLHEGTKVKVLDEVGSWRNVELADGRQGWLYSSEIEII